MTTKGRVCLGDDPGHQSAVFVDAEWQVHRWNQRWLLVDETQDAFVGGWNHLLHGDP
jgi:hypothetical protein